MDTFINCSDYCTSGKGMKVQMSQITYSLNLRVN